jgi:hypothetical protein
MYCVNCGQQLEKGSHFCPSCGTQVPAEGGISYETMSEQAGQPLEENKVQTHTQNQSLSKVQTANESSKLEVSRVDNREKRKLGKLWLVPVLSGVLALGSFGTAYAYQNHKTQESLQAYKQGEALALKGDYKGAEAKFKHSLELRSDFESAKHDLQVVSLALVTEKDITLANSLEKKGKYDQALNTIQSSEGHLANYKGTLIVTLNKSLSKARMVTSVAQLRQEMKGKTSVDDLAPVLRKAENLNFPEAKQIADEIRNQIADFSYSQANAQLEKNSFTEADNLIASGLKYAPSNQKLKTLKSTVAQKKKAFENAEEAKMEQAMVAAAKEQANNQSNAVQLVNISTYWDQFGDLVVTGTVKCIATVPISSVQINYNVTDSNGNELDTGQVYTDQNVLYPGDENTFEDTDYNITSDQISDPSNVPTATVTGATWYLQNQ